MKNPPFASTGEKNSDIPVFILIETAVRRCLGRVRAGDAIRRPGISRFPPFDQIGLLESFSIIRKSLDSPYALV